MTDSQEHNVNKFVYLTRKNPDKTNTEIISLFSMPAININATLWHAIDSKQLTLPDPKTDKCTVNSYDSSENPFGKIVEELEGTLLYCMKKLAEREQDIEDHYLDSWLAGYATHDIAVVKAHLLDTGKIATYQLRDEPNESDYTFYTLTENLDKKWGKSQFDTEKAGIE